MNDLICPKCGYEFFEVERVFHNAKREKHYTVKCLRCGHFDIVPEHVIKTGVCFLENIIATVLIILTFLILIYFSVRS